MIRRFVNLMAHNYNGADGGKLRIDKYSLHRVDVAKHLFYQSRDDAQVMPLVGEKQDGAAGAAGDEPPMIERVKELPPLCLNIGSSRTALSRSSHLMLARLLSPSRSEDKIICMTGCGDALLYNVDFKTMRTMPTLEDYVGSRPITVSIPRPSDAQEQEDDLYLMHKHPRQEPASEPSCFHVLRFSPSSKGPASWRWESLPRPPFIDTHWYKGISFPRSHTVVDGGRTICMSFQSLKELCIGTYCFDTAVCEWWHAGDWTLPFDGTVEYVPDLNLWLGLGLSDYYDDTAPHYLSATTDLSAMAKDKRPKLQYVWQDLVMPGGWQATRTNLVNLGGGRFCIAKYFQFRPMEGNFDITDLFVLTGVEIGKQQVGDEEGPIHAWKHRSILYPSSGISWVV